MLIPCDCIFMAQCETIINLAEDTIPYNEEATHLRVKKDNNTSFKR